MGTQLDHVSVIKKANIYFDGKCVSHTLFLPDKSKKTVGVIFPSEVTFSTDSPEIMEIVEGKCRVRIGETGGWERFEGGQRFHVPGKSRFDIEVIEPVHYVCHFTRD